jgi:DNA-binding NarL/FixJ family response regulator
MQLHWVFIPALVILIIGSVVTICFFHRLRRRAKPPENTIRVDLSPQEYNVLQLIARGETNKEIALTLNVGIQTVKNHTRNIYQKLGVGNRTEAAIMFLVAK